MSTFVCLLAVSCVNSARLNFSSMQHFIGTGAEAAKAMGISKEPCEPIEESALAKILGAAYNPRYMSVKPPDKSENSDDPSGGKRKSSGFRPFSVDEDYEQELDEGTPAWQTDHFTADIFTNKRKRDLLEHEREERSAKQSTPWECESNVKWIDLGRDFFPRYLRSIECGNHDCWYGRYMCRPKSFTVKILRRKHGRCAYNHRKESVFDLPKEMRELWVWEERAVNFCCECAP